MICLNEVGKTGGQSLVFFTSNKSRYVLAIVIKEGGLLSSRLFFLTGKLSDEVRYEKKADTPVEMMTIQ